MSTTAGPAPRSHTLVVPALAALTTWVTLLAWTPFSAEPAEFVVPLFFAVLLIGTTGVLLRWLRLPVPAVALVQAAVVLIWLVHRFGGADEVAGIVPTLTAVRHSLTELDDAVAASRAYAAPVPASVPAFAALLIVAGSVTALLVDVLAAGLRRAPLAGLPLLAVYTAPVSVIGGGVSWIEFAAAAMCFLFLIAAGEERRLSQWGDPLTPGSRLMDGWTSIRSHQAVWSSARKIGFTATGLAVVAPLVVPSFSTSPFGGGGSGGAGGAGDGVSITNPIVGLKRDLVRHADIPLVTMQTSEPDPSYLRVSVLNSFDGNAWKPSSRELPTDQRADGPLPDPPGLQAGVRSRAYTATVQVDDAFNSRWLPTPYPSSYVDAPGDWRYDRTTLDVLAAGDRETTAGLRYHVRSRVLAPTATQLADAGPAPVGVARPGTALPSDLPASVRTLARTVTRGQQTQFGEAVALQQFFRVDGGFTYSLQRAPGSSTETLVRFLGTGPGSRVGYCEQFAAAMALMGRTLGIPSRVAVGFLRPERTGPDTYTYSSHDLHAWPEMYFDGVGWVRFEPTPQDRSSAVPPYTRQTAPASAAPAPQVAPTATAPNRRVEARDQQAAAASARGGSTSGGGPSIVGRSVAALLLVLVALLPRAARTARRRRRFAGAGTAAAWVEAAWAELRDTARDLAISTDDRTTVRIMSRSWESSFGDPARRDDRSGTGGRSTWRGPSANEGAVTALHRLVGLLERSRYARELPENATSLEQVLTDVDTVCAAMRAGAGGRQRRRATWLPASLLQVRPRLEPSSVVAGPGVDRTVSSRA